MCLADAVHMDGVAVKVPFVGNVDHKQGQGILPKGPSREVVSLAHRLVALSARCQPLSQR